MRGIARVVGLGVVLAALLLGGCGRRGSREGPEGVGLQPEPLFSPGGEAGHGPQLDPWADMKPQVPYARELSAAAQAKLRENGFVVAAGMPNFSLREACWRTHSIHVTSDSVLYLLGSLFRGGLAQYERETLVPLLTEFVQEGVRASEADWRMRGHQLGLLEPAVRNVLLFGVAAELLSLEAPELVRTDAEQIARKIIEAREAGYYPEEDYTVYLVRGQYAQHPELAGYFRASKWLARAIMPLTPGAESAQESDVRLRQAVLLGLLMRRDKQLRRAWDRLRQEYDFLVGPPDALTPLQVADAADATLTGDYHGGATPALGTAQALAALRAEFGSDRYRPSAIMPVPQLEPGDLPAVYCQVLGERYIIDGEITQRTVFPYVGDRWLPSGLDVAATVLGFERAATHLAPGPELRAQLERLRAQFGPGAPDAPSADGGVYERWLHLLSLLSAEPHPNSPPYMRTEAWRDKQLNAALAGWASLRHDFILYAKEPVTPESAIEPGVFEGLVEPVPAVYAAAGALARDLAARGFPGMGELAALCEDLRLVAQAALGEPTGVREERLRLAANQVCGLARWLEERLTPYLGVEDPTGVADVHSHYEGGRGGILHVATGPLYPMIIQIEGENGPTERVGFVLSYHEWTEPDYRRVTDEQWRARVRAGDHHAVRPAWTASFMAR
ncbi:MAG: DUF3160 domain-containing protein [Armatimonadota bacterium]